MRQYSFEDVVILHDNDRIPLSAMERQKRQGPYRYYGAQGVIDYVDNFLFDGEYVLIAEDGENLKSQKQDVAQLVHGKFWVNNHAHIATTTSVCRLRYFYYLINNKDLSEYITGSAQPKLSQASMRKMNFYLPNLSTQDKILRILGPIDDKIEENERINKNLEAQAQAIYVNTFVTDADSSWPEGKLSDLIEVCYGKDHKKLNDGDIPVYGSGGIMRHVDQALYDQESVLVPRKGTLNNVMYVNEPFWSVDTMFFTKMKRQNVAKFVFHFLKGKDLAAMNAGSAVPSMTTKILDAIPLQIPDDQTLSTFEAQVSPFYQAVTYNNKESETLAAVRNALLPKLMSGEIDVSDIDL